MAPWYTTLPGVLRWSSQVLPVCLVRPLLGIACTISHGDDAARARIMQRGGEEAGRQGRHGQQGNDLEMSCCGFSLQQAGDLRRRSLHDRDANTAAVENRHGSPRHPPRRAPRYVTRMPGLWLAFFLPCRRCSRTRARVWCCSLRRSGAGVAHYWRAVQSAEGVARPTEDARAVQLRAPSWSQQLRPLGCLGDRFPRLQGCVCLAGIRHVGFGMAAVSCADVTRKETGMAPHDEHALLPILRGDQPSLSLPPHELPNNTFQRGARFGRLLAAPVG